MINKSFVVQKSVLCHLFGGYVSIHAMLLKPFGTPQKASRLHFRAVELRRQRSWSGATEVYRKVGVQPSPYPQKERVGGPKTKELELRS